MIMDCAGRKLLPAREKFLDIIPAHMNEHSFTLGRHKTTITRNAETGRLESWHGNTVQRSPVLTLEDVDQAISVLRAARAELQNQP